MSDYSIPNISDFDLNITDYSAFLSKVPEILPAPVAFSYSDTQYEILKKYIQDYDSTLD